MGTQLFHFKMPSHHSSDLNMTGNSAPTPQTSEGLILSTTEYQDNSNQQNQSTEIHYGDSDNLSDSILITFNNI